MDKTTESSYFYTMLVRISILLRLIFGPIIFLSPVIASVANLFLDGFDGELYKRASYSRPRYSVYDKILDYYWYIFIFVYIIVVNPPFKSLFITLFLFRSIGQIIFLITKNGVFLFFFPNIFEKFFLYYVITLLIPKSSTILLQPPVIYIAFLIIILLSFLSEIIIHVKKMNFSRFYLGKTSYWSIKTTNQIKAFVVFSLLITTGLSYSYLKINNNSFSYKSQATKSSLQGTVVTYEQKGIITGWVEQATESSYQILLFVDPDYKQLICQDTITLINISSAKRVYVFKKDCLANLADKNYFLLLVPVDRTGQSYSLEFTINNSQLR